MADLGTELHISDDGSGLSLRGEVDAHTAPELETALSERVPGVDATLRVEMSGLTFMDSSGLRVLIAATAAARSAGGDIVLVRPSSAVSRLIEVSGLAGHLSVDAADD